MDGLIPSKFMEAVKAMKARHYPFTAAGVPLQAAMTPPPNTCPPGYLRRHGSSILLPNNPEHR